MPDIGVKKLRKITNFFSPVVCSLVVDILKVYISIRGLQRYRHINLLSVQTGQLTAEMFQQWDRTNSLHVQELRSNWAAAIETICGRALELISYEDWYFPKTDSDRSLTDAVQILTITVTRSYKQNNSHSKKWTVICARKRLTWWERDIFLTLRRLMSYIYIYIYIYGAPILDVSRSHTTTQHSR